MTLDLFEVSLDGRYGKPRGKRGKNIIKQARLICRIIVPSPGRRPIMRCKALRHGFSLVVVGILIVPTILSAQQNLSHVRVVRLSYVSGTVGVKRPASTEWAKGQVNTPIQEGFELSTAANSYAEVEFENGSTARLGEFSKVNFDQLAMDQDGNKLNRLTFEQGYATFHFLPEHEDAYSVKIAETTLTPNGKSEFRTDLEHGRARVEVFAGSVELTAASQTVKLGKDKVLEFDPQATQVDVRARYPSATLARGSGRFGARPALWLERFERLRRMGILPRFWLWLVAFCDNGLVALQHGDVELVSGHGLCVDFR